MQARLSIENLNLLLWQICSAIKAADAHDRILIAKGVYNEALLVDKAIELVDAPPPAPNPRNPKILVFGPEKSYRKHAGENQCFASRMGKTVEANTEQTSDGRWVMGTTKM